MNREITIPIKIKINGDNPRFCGYRSKGGKCPHLKYQEDGCYLCELFFGTNLSPMPWSNRKEFNSRHKRLKRCKKCMQLGKTPANYLLISGY